MRRNGKPLHKFVILVAEDDYLQALAIEELLSAAGAKVVGPATTLEKAVALATQEHFNCAVLDVRLKDEDIDVVAMVIEEQGKGFVFITGSEPIPLLRKWPSAQVVSKPYSEPELIEAIKIACKGSARKAA
ncbi:MAG: response regulator [Rhodomicrobium sp.]